MTPYGAKIWVIIGSSNDLLPDGITWTNVDLSSLRSSDVNLMAISFEISQPSVTKISLKIIFLRVYWNFPGTNELTHWGRVTHICVSKLAIIDSDKAIIWTNAGILLIGPLGTKLNEISIEIHIFSFKKIHLKLSSGKWRPFCLGLNVLNRSSSSMRQDCNHLQHLTFKTFVSSEKTANNVVDNKLMV